jgi:hypothetical protein
MSVQKFLVWNSSQHIDQGRVASPEEQHGGVGSGRPYCTVIRKGGHYFSSIPAGGGKSDRRVQLPRNTRLQQPDSRRPSVLGSDREDWSGQPKSKIMVATASSGDFEPQDCDARRCHWQGIWIALGGNGSISRRPTPDPILSKGLIVWRSL